MNAVKTSGIVLIAAGVLGLAYGASVTRRRLTTSKLGPIVFAVKEKQTVNVPVWSGAGAVVIGTVLLLLGGRKP